MATPRPAPAAARTGRWISVVRKSPTRKLGRGSSAYGIRFSSRHIGYLLDDPPRLARVWGELMAFVAAHGIRPVVGATFSFHQIAEAHRLMESRRSVGKIVVRM